MEEIVTCICMYIYVNIYVYDKYEINTLVRFYHYIWCSWYTYIHNSIHTILYPQPSKLMEDINNMYVFYIMYITIYVIMEIASEIRGLFGK